ncbi:MAG: VOC family protein [Deltaproteobacteria bacterium]|nr:VOC family protein [Deltaproteobacteria bacterium]
MSVMFHLAFPSHDLDQAYDFYIKALGCEAGRRSEHALIINFFGHQIVAQKVKALSSQQKGIYPRHFGVVLASLEAWEALKEQVQDKGLKFYQAPKVRYQGQALEHYTFFLEDPSHNLLEFKFYSESEAIFGHGEVSSVGEEER